MCTSGGREREGRGRGEGIGREGGREGGGERGRGEGIGRGGGRGGRREGEREGGEGCMQAGESLLFAQNNVSLKLIGISSYSITIE